MDAAASTRNTGSSLLTKYAAASCISSQHLQPEDAYKFRPVSRSASSRAMQSHPLISARQKLLPRSRSSVSHPSAGVSSLTATGLDTSTVRRQLSDLQFNSTAEPRKVERQAKSASDIILLRNSLVDAENPLCFTPKPKVQKLRRRKQEFDQLLQTPPYERQNARGKTLVEHRKSETDSGFVSFYESANSAVESELRLPTDDVLIRSQTPPSQISVRSSVDDTDDIVEPISGADAEEDVNMMLFTPFKIVDGCSELPELSPDIELSASIVAGSDSWVSFTPVCTGARARTSTPCRLLGTPSLEDQSKQPSSCSDSCAGVKLSNLLSEFSDDNGLSSFDGATGCGNMPIGNLTSTDVFILDEAFELDVKDLSFSDLH